MSDISLHITALLASIAGMACFALSIDAHWRQFFRGRPCGRAAKYGLRLAGGGLIALAFQLCAVADPISMAALVWPMLLTLAAGSVAAMLTIHARFGANSKSG